MNIFLLSLIDKSIGGAMVRLSKLPIQSPVLNPIHRQILVRLTEQVFTTYINFFKSVRIIPPGYEYLKTELIKAFNNIDFVNEDLDFIDKKLINLIKVPIETSVIPVNMRLNKTGMLFWYTGIAILESNDQSSEFFLHKLSINVMSIRHSSVSLYYLDRILEEGHLSESVSPRELATKHGKNYNQFQKDCKTHFGDTFHQFHNKMKMLAVVDDILFTDYSFKEVAYRNDFFNYNSMYILFYRKYKFPIDAIPRLLTEI